MSRLGTWKPTTIEERLDRMESLAAIRQLPHRYGVAIDSRDMDMMVDLFVPDVRVGKDETGREALKRWYTERRWPHPRRRCASSGTTWSTSTTPTTPTAVVYCHDELDQPDEGRVGHRGCCSTGTPTPGSTASGTSSGASSTAGTSWTGCRRPSHGAGVDARPGRLSTYLLPDAYPSWAAYWARVEAEGVVGPAY